MQRFYLGTHCVEWLGQVDVPLCVSHRRLHRRRTLPRASAPLAIDSGGYSELFLHGRWLTPPDRYVADARRYVDEIGQLDWLAAQDWMCEPWILKRTGLTVADHQRLTIENYLTLLELGPDLPWTPVLQGYALDDYHRHVEQYGRAGVDLARLPVVGVGSVCRRQATNEIEPLMRSLAAYGLRLHGFGVKVSGLRRAADVLVSADSLVWSFVARQETIRLDGCRHLNCANCPRWALDWRQQLLATLTNAAPRDRYADLFPRMTA